MKAVADMLQKVDALTLRERVILFVLLLAGIWALMDAVLLGPQDRARQAAQQKLTQARSQLADAAQTLTQFANQPDPDAAARQRLDSARQSLNAGLQSATRLQARLVAPKDMVRVLEGMLAEQPGLAVSNLTTLAPEAVGLPAAAKYPTAGAPPTKPAEAALYKHGVKLTLVGNYAALTQYMEKLERLPVGFYWARAELDASGHPAISLTLTLYTLSLEKTWLTV
jgi:MSHA biogenesis protein MshJ